MTVELRALERDDLRFVHRLNNDSSVMTYWFDEPFESLAELTDIYDRHIHDNRERRFVVETGGADRVQVGIVELVEIEPVHLTAEFQIIVAPDHQGKGYASTATDLALRYAFATLNLHKVYLIVDVENAGAIHVYEKNGFAVEGTLREEFFAAGRYRNAFRMGILQRDYLEKTA
ncbi:spermidine N1-acetyltransferase [Kineococcus sp. DHX-1]|uniref:spermidine N1-acetyltransferase n=1 Tax=Kineococcus sp. DHX-1 TaxID=3349638 RepID=UPI0036D3DE29